MNPDEKTAASTMSSRFPLERELIANLAVRGTGVYSRTTNVIRVQNNLRPYDAYNIPVTRPDPGPDGSVGNADDPGHVDHVL